MSLELTTKSVKYERCLIWYHYTCSEFNHEAPVSKHEARVSKHEARVSKHEARVSKHEARVSKHEARVSFICECCKYIELYVVLLFSLTFD